MALIRPGLNTSEQFTLNSVVSYCPIASAVGARVLREGGNAVDAAVATALALAVTYPQAGNLGGGGFMMVHDASTRGVHFLDYRETAPRRIRADQFLQFDGTRSLHSLKGGLPVGVPGTIRGLAAALERFGTWSWDHVVGPAIELAEKGIWLTTRQTAYLNRYRTALGEFDATRHCFCEPSELGYLPGTLFQQADLGRALRRLADQGPEDFYSGGIAEMLCAEVQRNNGIMQLDDLASYEVKWRQPLTTPFMGRTIYTAPLPSGGGVVIVFALRMLKALGIETFARASAERYTLMARVFRVAFALRHRFAADPDYLDPRDLEDVHNFLARDFEPSDLDVLEENYVASVDPERTPHFKPENTTHFCVVDAEGNAVSNTYSLNTLFGSKLVVGGCGFLLNNSMDDFQIGENTPNWYGIIDGSRNQLVPKRRPVGSMTPTIVHNANNEIELVLGGSGGPMIPTLVTQSMLGVFLDGLSLTDALGAPRIHHQFLKPELKVEDMIPESVVQKINIGQDPIITTPNIGIGAGIQRLADGSRVFGVLDRRFGHYQ